MEYLRTAAEFTRQFATEEACWDYVVKLAVACGLSKPRLRKPQGLDDVDQTLSVWCMRVRSIHYG